jgi:hypothetical protein
MSRCVLGGRSDRAVSLGDLGVFAVAALIPGVLVFALRRS